jgi:rifampicin phosphotransferase
MLAPEAAGVAFTADPVTGRRDEVVITAARGLGERVVSGQAVGDEWVVKQGTATLRRSVEQAIDEVQAASIGVLARRVEEHFGTPQDIEWAVDSGQVYLLQARPMTALPEAADWTPPGPGYWMRTFELGEWLPDPITPLFRDWLLERIEAGTQAGMRATAGTVMPFGHAVVNGWYYAATPKPDPGVFLRAVVESRGKIFGVLLNAIVRVSRQPEVADRKLLRRLANEWRDVSLPRYKRLVAAAERQVAAATAGELIGLVDALGRMAGEQFWALALVGGSAWKMEGCLGRFVRTYVPTSIDGGVLVLMRGLPGLDLAVPEHAVQSLDWYWPTVGELGTTHRDVAQAERHQRLVAEREAAEAACRRCLASRPKLRARFDTLLEVTQRYAAIREEQARWLTLGWPALRHCALRLGELLCARGIVEHAEDVFFLEHRELLAEAPLRELVEQRRAEWERQRRLVAPLTLGTPSRLVDAAITQLVNAVRAPTPGHLPAGAIMGHPASPGRARGPVRVVRGTQDFDRFRAGEVLVARATTPAWTPLFSRAAAVVTDGGSLAAHASLVAREYGIPAVVGTADATVRLRDGQTVVVDGSAGLVELAEA